MMSLRLPLKSILKHLRMQNIENAVKIAGGVHALQKFEVNVGQIIRILGINLSMELNSRLKSIEYLEKLLCVYVKNSLL